MFLFVCVFVCAVTDFSAAEKESGVKLCMHVPLLSAMSFSHFGHFSHFGELWLAGSHGGGITSGMSYIQMAPANHLPSTGQLELRVAASRKTVWWDLHLASLLTHLLLLLLTKLYFWCARLAELGRQLKSMQDEAVGDVHVSVEQFRDHLETTVKALHESTTQLSQSFTSVTSVYLLTYLLAYLFTLPRAGSGAVSK